MVKAIAGGWGRWGGFLLSDFFWGGRGSTNLAKLIGVHALRLACMNNYVVKLLMCMLFY